MSMLLLSPCSTAQTAQINNARASEITARETNLLRTLSRFGKWIWSSWSALGGLPFQNRTSKKRARPLAEKRPPAKDYGRQ